MGRSETVGSLIQRLFPFGFGHEIYNFLLMPGRRHTPAKEKLMRELMLSDGGATSTLKVLREKFVEKRDENLVQALKGVRESTAAFSKKGRTVSAKVPRRYLCPPCTPFDTFAIAAVLLVKSGAYHHFESEMRYFDGDSDSKRDLRRIYRIKKRERRKWCKQGRLWHDIGNISKYYAGMIEESDRPHRPIHDWWAQILCAWEDNVFATKSEKDSPPYWWKAAFALVVASDEACRDAGFRFKSSLPGDIGIWARLAEFLIIAASAVESDGGGERETLAYIESLSFAARNIVTVLPKSKTAPVGCTIRALTHNLALLPGTGEIRVGWAWTEHSASEQRPIFNMLVLPYPYRISSSNFVGTAHPADRSIRSGMFGISVNSDKNSPIDSPFFEFFESLMRTAKAKVDQIHCVVVPELALSWDSTKRLMTRCADEPSIELLCTGVREHPFRTSDSGDRVPANGAFMASYTDVGGRHLVRHKLFHEKHHRWRLTEQQILDYGLSRSLDPSRIWWEDIRVINRKLPFLVMRDKWVVTTLICEDLARNDPTRPVVESIGPNLVISLLMDGPQLDSRWPAKYAGVLAEDPGCSVLTVTSLGLVERSNKIRKAQGLDESTVIAMWRDHKRTVPIELARSSHAVVLSVSQYPSEDCTLDGRFDDRATALTLSDVKQIRANWGDSSKSSVVRYPAWDAS